MNKPILLQVAGTSAALLGAYFLGRWTAPRDVPPRLAAPKPHAWPINGRWHVDEPFINQLQHWHFTPGPNPEPDPGPGWEWFDMQKFVIKARKVATSGAIPDQSGALFELAPDPELNPFMRALSRFGAIDAGPTYRTMDEARKGLGFRG